MNPIKYLGNYIQKSNFVLFGNNQFDSQVAAKVKATLSFPKSPQVGQKIRCMLDLTVGEENETVLNIFVQLCVLFEIEQLDDEKELEKYAQDFCIKQSMEIMQDKLAQLTKLHSGVPLELPLTDNL